MFSLPFWSLWSKVTRPHGLDFSWVWWQWQSVHKEKSHCQVRKQREQVGPNPGFYDNTLMSTQEVTWELPSKDTFPITEGPPTSPTSQMVHHFPVSSPWGRRHINFWRPWNTETNIQTIGPTECLWSTRHFPRLCSGNKDEHDRILCSASPRGSVLCSSDSWQWC